MRLLPGWGGAPCSFDKRARLCTIWEGGTGAAMSLHLGCARSGQAGKRPCPASSAALSCNLPSSSRIWGQAAPQLGLTSISVLGGGSPASLPTSAAPCLVGSGACKASLRPAPRGEGEEHAIGRSTPKTKHQLDLRGGGIYPDRGGVIESPSPPQPGAGPGGSLLRPPPLYRDSNRAMLGTWISPSPSPRQGGV